jgi:hypothetical protein
MTENAMTRWTDVPHNIVELQERYQELTRRALDVRSVELLRERGEYDPDRHGMPRSEPLTAAEWSLVLAYGRAIAKYYDHPANVHQAVRAGLSWQDVAEAIGADPAQARAEYRAWAAGQRQLNAREPGSRIGMTADAYAEALALADDGTTPGTVPRDASPVGAAVLPGVDLADADTVFVLTTALQEFAHRQRGEADDIAQDITSGDNVDPAAGIEVDRLRRWAEIADTIAETALDS